MTTRRLGNNGPEVSLVGQGCNNFGGRTSEEDSRKVIYRALDLGVTFFDTADIYGNKGGSEEIIGRALGARRNEMFLATKFGGQMDEDGALKGASAQYIAQAVEASLRRLKTDHIDLYQVHVEDEITPIAETLTALDHLVQSGKVRFIGCSNHPAWKVVDASWIAATRNLTGFVSAQDEFSMLHRDAEKELIPALKATGMGLLPYFPLASGMLSGKYQRGKDLPAGTRFAGSPGLVNRYMNDVNWDRVEKWSMWAAERGHTLLDLAFAWLAAQEPVACIIAGATKPEQVEQNARAADWTLGPEDLQQLSAL
jgi:aryl-alcohol dehydrogenase-like predicted oxidoreductase